MTTFTSVSELPSQVRENLDAEAQSLFLAAYNASYSIKHSETEAYEYAWLKTVQPGTTELSDTKAYFVDLAGYTLDEGDTAWIQALPLGKWHHPRFGEINITDAKCAEFEQNVKSNVRGQDLDIDYDHKEYGGGAAGWVKDAQHRPGSGLWLLVQWTRQAADQIKNKVYRYFSPEYMDEWLDPRTKTKIKNVLCGGALTNRPFLKGILPINLSEVLSGTSTTGGKMDWKEMASLLGLPDNTPEDKVKEAFKQRLAPLGSTDGNGNKPPEPKPTTTEATTPATPEPKPKEENKPSTVAASEGKLTPEVLKLAESDPVVRMLADKVTALEAANRLSEVDRKLADLDTEEYAVAPAVATKLRDLMIELPTALSDKTFETVKELVAQGIGAVPLNEFGRVEPNNERSATKQFSDAVDAKMKSDTNMTYGQATELVANENPRLFNAYRDETYLKEGAK